MKSGTMYIKESSTKDILIFHQDMLTRIKIEIIKGGVQKKHVANYLTISPASLSQRLTGEIPFTIGELARLSDLFNCTIDFLVKGIVGTK